VRFGTNWPDQAARESGYGGDVTVTGEGGPGMGSRVR